MRIFAVVSSVAFAVSAWATPANAATLNFDDIAVNSGSYKKLADYGGLTWNNMFVENNIDGGYNRGIVSQTNAVLNRAGMVGSFSASTPFIFNSAYFTGAFSDGQYTATGFVGNVQTYQQTFSVLTSAPTLVNFDWTGLNSVSIVRTGGGGQYLQFVMDNLTINQPVTPSVPEATTWAMMIVGMGAIGTTMRRRRKVTTRVSYAA